MANERRAGESDSGEKRQRENCCEQKTLCGAADEFHSILRQKNLHSVRKTECGREGLTGSFERGLFVVCRLCVRLHVAVGGLSPEAPDGDVADAEGIPPEIEWFLS